MGTLMAVRAASMLASSITDNTPTITEQPHFDPEDSESTSMYNLDEFQAIRHNGNISITTAVQCAY
eukprot:8645201-Pyramimonas_sp.AAC.1